MVRDGRVMVKGWGKGPGIWFGVGVRLLRLSSMLWVTVLGSVLGLGLGFRVRITVRVQRSGLAQLNSTENYGRRCLAPLSPHRNYILS